LLAHASKRVGAHHYGAERQQSGAAQAERLVREELGRLGWQDADLVQRRKGGPGKVRIARRLRQETTLTLKWIAERLQMGGWTYVSNLVNGHGPGAKPSRQRRSIKSEDSHLYVEPRARDGMAGDRHQGFGAKYARVQGGRAGTLPAFKSAFHSSSLRRTP